MRHATRRLPACSGLLLLLGLLLAAPPATAQQFEWPEKAENLKVLPEDTSPQQLRATMISFTRSLGVRCEHCHDDSQGNRLSQMDFAADTKENKDVARVMMQMVRRINGEELEETGRPAEERLRVTCVMCHRGNARPIMLEDELAEVIEAEGVEAAVARYHTLRERFAGGFTYDFREDVLNTLGYRLLGAGQVDDAIVIFKLNVAQFPDAWNVYDSLAEAYMTKGQTEAAIALFRESLVRNPDNQNAVQMLQKLRDGGE